MNSALVEVSGLTVRAGNRLLLDNLNWQVLPGEQWVVFGANGSGKTTLLSVISGFRRWTSGGVALFGESLDESNVIGVRKRIGWVSGSFFDNYYRSESAMEIVLSGLTGSLSLDFSLDADDVGLALGWLDYFGVADKRDMPFSSMSKGQRQKVLLARAMLCDPDILVLDEPCSGLDVDAREQTLVLVDEIIHKGEKSVVYVTHYVEEILESFTKALLMKNGRCFASGTVDDCFGADVMSRMLDMPVDIERDAAGRRHLLLHAE